MFYCTICLTSERASARMLPCRHAFHVVCLWPWLDQKHSCPTCHAPFELERTYDHAVEYLYIWPDVPWQLRYGNLRPFYLERLAPAAQARHWLELAAYARRWPLRSLRTIYAQWLCHPPAYSRAWRFLSKNDHGPFFEIARARLWFLTNVALARLL